MSASLFAKRSALTARPVSRSVPRTLPSGLFVKPSALAQKKIVARAEGETSSIDTEALMNDVKAKFDAIEDKPKLALYGAGALLGLYLTNGLLGFLNKVPLLPKLFEFVGLSYATWFTYNRLLFKSGRTELLQDFESLKEKVVGETPAPAATPTAPAAAATPAAAPKAMAMADDE